MYIKTCQRCFFCHSIAWCPICDKCPSCCKKSACRGQTSKLLANLAGKRCRTENSSNLERGLHPPLSDPAKPYKVSHRHKPLCQSPQEQLPVGGITSAYGQKCNRVGPQSNISRVFQPTFSGTQTQQQVETYTRSKQTKSFPQGGEVQNGDKLSRLNQTIQTEWSLLPDIFQDLCRKWHRPQIDLFATRFNKLPLFVSPVPDTLAVAVDALTLPWEDLDAYAFPPTAILGKVVEKLQETHSDCSGVAQHGLVLGLSDHVQPGPSKPAQPAQPADTALQSDPSQKSDKSKSPCLDPRATTIKEQGFFEAGAARIEAPQRRSTRSVYEAKWAIFTKWCVSNQVDFRSPPVKSVADFLMYLFEDKKLQPSTIDGYRSAIADKLGSTRVNISKDDNLTRLLESFHRDRPRGRRGIPSWNLSLVLHQLTRAPFEPLREASRKHLTFKTVFLLALGSGKRRSEIHAWQHKNIRHQSDWSKVSLFPSPSFLSKNQLAKEGPESVAPVVIPALAPTLDKSLKSDRSLCPVRALRYYLDRTSDLRQHKELVFVSFKKGFDRDISPATISSWIKQTVILCYELSDHQAHTLHQVKAHDVRAFAASKAFQSGVSLEQILAGCHWKSHNTFTQYYLKDVAWADSELYHLGPVVAAQQIHQQTGT